MNFIEKYRPQNSSELIVSPRIISDIRNWIKLWKEGTPVKKALILYGPPGTGKTTTASVLAKEMNVPIVEMNASDQRNADAMKRIALMASLYGDLSQIDSSQSGFNKIILIDEADNIFEGRSRETGGDSGGLTELSRVVSRTMNPIILTMNDYYAFRRKNSAREIINNSLVIEYRQYRRKGDNEYKLFRSRIIERIREIASKENMRFNTDAIERLVDKNSDDIRSTINDTMSVLSYTDDPGPSGEASVRDIQSSIYDVVHTTFKDRNYEKTLFQLYEKDFTTEDYLMWIDENLHSEAPDLNDLSEAYDLLSLSDSFIGRVLKKQHYAFKGYAEELAAGIFNRIEHPNQKYVKYEFPSYIMKMSRLRDARESRKSAVSKLSRFTHSGKLRTSSMLWFFSDFLKSKANLAGLSDKLLLSEKEISVLKRR
ncbi:MAG: replication factor C large subunit [Candidatus Thermoplasmatota archaeon]|nr:replication factor C large subunit [Candidatus Thermoplasmatota archaeon]